MEILKNKLVSILIPIYNGEKYIERCLESILEQTYNHIQLILINDGSNDKTDDLIKDKLYELSNNLESVTYLIKENGGVGSAINKGLKYFEGEFLYLYDVDDILLPNAVNDCVKFLIENKEYSAVQANGYYVTEENIDLKEKLFFYDDYRIVDDDLFMMLINGQTFNWPGSYMIRSNDWLRANKSREIYESRNGQNMQMLFPATYKNKTGLLNKPVMKYIVHPNSLSHFQGKDAYFKEIDASLKYEDIYLCIINNLVEENDKNLILNTIKHTFISSRLNKSIKYKSKKEMKKYYNELKKYNLVTLNDKINYFQHINKGIYYYLKILRKIKMMVNK